VHRAWWRTGRAWHFPCGLRMDGGSMENYLGRLGGIRA
jgi:hypothetical protein